MFQRTMSDRVFVVLAVYAGRQHQPAIKNDRRCARRQKEAMPRNARRAVTRAGERLRN